MEVKWVKKNLDLSKEIGSLLTASKKTVASAESCTGGLLATFLTEFPGSSNFYRGGVSCYSNFSKTKLLSVSPSTLETVGAVSQEVALALARNVCQILNAEFGLSATGIAGPDGGTVHKPVGTVWCGITSNKGDKVWCLHLKGSRESIRMQTVNSILTEFLKILKG